MADDKKSPPTYPVARLKFTAPTDIPGDRNRDQLVATPEAKPTERSYTIDFIPHLRHHRITHRLPNSTKTETWMVHESRVAGWEPGPL